MSAKEAKNVESCRGKRLDCRNGADKGLQYGLSGNSVPDTVTPGTDHNGKPPDWQRQVVCGEIQPNLKP